MSEVTLNTRHCYISPNFKYFGISRKLFTNLVMVKIEKVHRINLVSENTDVVVDFKFVGMSAILDCWKYGARIDDKEEWNLYVFIEDTDRIKD